MSEQKSILQSKVDPRTGKQIVVRDLNAVLEPPSAKSVSPIDSIVGKNPPVQSLRDHPEWNGQEIMVTDVTFGDGMIGDRKTEYAMMYTYIYPVGKQPTKENFVFLRTGADNVYQRVAAAWSAGQLPVKGVLRLAGRKWLID